VGMYAPREPRQHLCHRVPSVGGSGFRGTGTPACVLCMECISQGTGRSACATHGLFMRAFSTACGFLSITVKQARTALSGALRACSPSWSERRH
jgi:hypothetical protein